MASTQRRRFCSAASPLLVPCFAFTLAAASGSRGSAGGLGANDATSLIQVATSSTGGAASDISSASARPWSLPDVQRRLNYLTGGGYLVNKSGPKFGGHAFYEYVLDGSAPFGPKPRFFGVEELKQCLAGRWVHLYGDSRIRFLYATLLADLNLMEDSANDCPHHRACPQQGQWGKHLKECGPYFAGARNGTCWAWQLPGGGRVSFEWNQWAKARIRQNSPLRGGYRPDVLLADNGIWAVWNNYGDKVGEDRPPQGPEGTEDRLGFFAELSSLVPKSKTLKVFVGYPRCPEQRYTHRSISDLEAPLLQHLPGSGWVTLRPYNFTRSVRPTGRKWVTIWSPDMLPMSVASRSKIKWDACDGPHTTDTLSELEMQILYNTICA